MIATTLNRVDTLLPFLGKTVILLLLIFVGQAVKAQNTDNNDTWLRKLDTAIENADQYIRRKQEQLGKLQSSLRAARTSEERYRLNMELYKAYRSFRNDSALAALTRCQQIAESTKRTDRVNHILALMARQCSVSGYYQEALTMFNRVDTTTLSTEGLIDYYKAGNHIYGELGTYSNLENVKQSCYGMAATFEKRLFARLSPRSTDYLSYRSQQLFNRHHYRLALELNTRWLHAVPENSRDFAVVAYYRHLIYRDLGQHDMEQYWLTRSSIADVEHAVMDQGSLWSLADLLSNAGQLDRAYTYISYSWKCATTFGTRVRSYQISPILSVIEQNYQRKQASTNTTLQWLVAAVSFMVVLLVVLLFNVNKQRRKLAEARNELRCSNEQLDAQNKLLQEQNETISTRNSQLNESNRVKEAYIGRFLALCSLYIDKMETLRKRMHKLVKAKNYEALYEQTRSTELKEKELDELYANFDEAFLHLFPNFVADFNNLLRKEERITPPSDKELNTTLRIFALIRLGIDDSSKIAEFLHYSVNTIYNYRAKVKNGAAIERSDFEKHVKQLGLISDEPREEMPA